MLGDREFSQKKEFKQARGPSRSLSFVGTLALALVVGTTACQKNEKVVDANKADIRANSTMEPEPVALAGEQLVSPYTFMLADKVFDMALAKDPNNYRSRFYKALLKPLMVFQGVTKRLRPYVTAKGDIRKFDMIAAEMPNSPALDFMLNGTEDIADAAGVQALIDRYIDALAELYQFLKTNEETALTVNLNAQVWEAQLRKDVADDCAIITDTEQERHVRCNVRSILQRKIALPDMIALRHQVAGMMLYAMIYNSYSLDGVDDLIVETQKNPHSKANTAEQYAKLDNLPRFGLLRPSQRFGMLRTFGADLSAAWKYVVSHRSDVCPATEYPWQKPRKGYVFAGGFCQYGVRSEDEKNVALLDQAMRGPISILTKNGEGRTFSLMLDAFRFADQPIANLKSVFPAQYNACGEVAAFRDPSFGGVLPRGDGNVLLKEECRK